MKNKNMLSKFVATALGSFCLFTSVYADFLAVNDLQWDDTAVRKVLHTFAYGGFATDTQIATWADMAPELAIREILTFAPTNDRLSPLGTDPVYNNVQNYLYSSVGDDLTLASLQANWAGDIDNPTPSASRAQYNVLTGNSNRLRTSSLGVTWAAATNKRGVNTFRQKVGLWLTNYHMSVHLRAVQTNPVHIRSMYDNAMSLLAQGHELDQSPEFWRVLASGAASSAVAEQYGHKDSTYRNGVFKGNDDFAREFHQLFFGIIGVNPANPDDAAYKTYYEDVTVENTAKLLTGMHLERSLGYYQTTDFSFTHDYIIFDDYFSDWMLDRNGLPLSINNASDHFAGDLDILNFDQTVGPISGNTAKEKIDALAAVAINDPESERNLPVRIIAHFADDRINPENNDDPLLSDIREAWVSSGKNLLTFLRNYSTSTAFHDPDRYKYQTSIDRNMTTMLKNTVDNEESFRNQLYSVQVSTRMKTQGAEPFYPAHFVFGGQTSLDAANNPNVFKNAYNQNVDNQHILAKTSDANGWVKDWSKIIPVNVNGQYQVGEVARWLWNHFIADGLLNYGPQEHAYITALLSKGNDFSSLFPAPAEEGYTTDQLNTDPELLAKIMENETDTLDFLLSVDNQRVGYAINFITATPFMFVQGGM